MKIFFFFAKESVHAFSVFVFTCAPTEYELKMSKIGYLNALIFFL